MNNTQAGRLLSCRVFYNLPALFCHSLKFLIVRVNLSDCVVLFLACC